MGLFKFFANDYFDDAALEQNGGHDSGEYDSNHAATDPKNPIWTGAEVHFNSYGTDPTWPDPNEVNQD